MPLTPADIHNIAFKKPPIGKRGYDEEEVDAFLDEVEQELIRLLEENLALRDKVSLGGAAPAGPSSTMVLNNEFADLAAQLERLQEQRNRAEQKARSLQAELERARSASAAAPPPAPGDDERTARVLMMAQRTADDHMRDARKESETLLEAARDEAAKISADASLRAETIEDDARRNHSEAITSIGTKRDALLDEIDRLGQLAHTYQAALGDHVTRQLQELDSVSQGAGQLE